uniref:RNA-directed RNA polymerase L n=1 Tax=Thrips tabaci bunya-like virus 2 TaxID=2771488 RepID=A0A7H1D355_9VIRU|nr:putative RNA dependent RNA polymerase [Thrips tabaci bunya-like virus 2]
MSKRKQLYNLDLIATKVFKMYKIDECLALNKICSFRVNLATQSLILNKVDAYKTDSSIINKTKIEQIENSDKYMDDLPDKVYSIKNLLTGLDEENRKKYVKRMNDITMKEFVNRGRIFLQPVLKDEKYYKNKAIRKNKICKANNALIFMRTVSAVNEINNKVRNLLKKQFQERVRLAYKLEILEGAMAKIMFNCRMLQLTSLAKNKLNLIKQEKLVSLNKIGKTMLANIKLKQIQNLSTKFVYRLMTKKIIAEQKKSSLKKTIELLINSDRITKINFYIRMFLEEEGYRLISQLQKNLCQLEDQMKQAEELIRCQEEKLKKIKGLIEKTEKDKEGNNNTIILLDFLLSTQKDKIDCLNIRSLLNINKLKNKMKEYESIRLNEKIISCNHMKLIEYMPDNKLLHKPSILVWTKKDNFFFKAILFLDLEIITIDNGFPIVHFVKMLLKGMRIVQKLVYEGNLAHASARYISDNRITNKRLTFIKYMLFKEPEIIVVWDKFSVDNVIFLTIELKVNFSYFKGYTTEKKISEKIWLFTGETVDFKVLNQLQKDFRNYLKTEEKKRLNLEKEKLKILMKKELEAEERQRILDEKQDIERRKKEKEENELLLAIERKRAQELEDDEKKRLAKIKEYKEKVEKMRKDLEIERMVWKNAKKQKELKEHINDQEFDSKKKKELQDYFKEAMTLEDWSEEVDLNEEKDYLIIRDSKLVKLKKENCCINGIISDYQAKGLVLSLENLTFRDFESISCINNLYVTAIKSLNPNVLENHVYINFLIKFRHDLFSQIFLKKSLDVDIDETDVGFKELYGIESNRTPDYIHEPYDENKFLVQIIEFSVSSSSDFVDSIKGTPSDAKYYTEMEMLRQKGFEVQYIPIILRFDRSYEKNHDEWKAYGFDVDLEEFYNTFRSLSNDIFRNFYHLILMNNRDYVNDEIKEWKKNLKKRSRHFVMNSKTKMEVLKRYKNKILQLIQSFKEPDAKVSFVYNATRSTVSAIKDSEGIDVRNVDDWINNDIDIEKLKNFLRINRGESLKEAEFKIVDYIEIENDTQTSFEMHNGTCDVNFKDFQKKINNTIINYSPAPYKEFEKGVPSLFNFDEVVDKAINLIENPIDNQSLFYHNVNDQKRREEIHEYMVKHVKKVNVERKGYYFAPKSSLTCFIKEQDVVRDRVYILDNDFMDSVISVSEGYFKGILHKIKNCKALTSKLAASNFDSLDTKKQLHVQLIEKCNRSRSEWLKSETSEQVKMGLLKFKDDRSAVCLEYKKNLNALNKYNSDLSAIGRKLSIEKDRHYLIQLTKNEMKAIDEELSRDHNSRGFKGTGAYQTFGLEWNKNLIYDEFRKFLGDLTKTSVESNDFTICYEGMSDDCNLFKQFKQECLTDLQTLEKNLSLTSLGSTLEFNSWLFKSLIFLSNTNLKNKYITVDTCGYRDNMLIVRGGKKMTHQSRTFKVITKISSSSEFLYTCRSESNWQIFSTSKGKFLVTPWMRFGSGLCEHHFTLKYKLTSFMSVMNEETGMPAGNLQSYHIPILAAFNGRRKLEELMFNFRQMLMNYRAKYSLVTELFKKVVGYSRDYTNYFIMVYFVDLIEGFKKDLKLFNDPLTGECTRQINNWTIFMYGSRIMPKAAVNPTTELRNDIIQFVETFENCKINKNSDISKNEIKFEDDPFTHDLNFNPELSWLVGVYLEDYLKNKQSISDVLKSVQKAYNTNIYETANSSGCRLLPDEKHKRTFKDINHYLDTITSRSEISKQNRERWGGKKQSKSSVKFVPKQLEKNIFGLKGYQAYYQTFENDLMSYETIEKALNAPGPVSAASILRKDKNTLFDFYKKNGYKIKPIYLSIHSKIQWGGMREIFSMAVESKINQQLAEKTFGGICKLIENEMISIPSDRRNVWLHSTIHQRTGNNPHILSYDYRRWGPHSNFLKYKYMVLGMINILPDSFVKFFLNLTENMLQKRIIIKKEDLKAIYNHVVCRSVFDSNDIEYHDDYIAIKYPHSFVMGIYNYLSSIFHAGSQLLFRHLTHLSKIKKMDKKFDFYGIAHSDDAQAIVDVSKEETLTKVVHSYEVFNKHLNHMQSNKKCMIDKENSEVISILRVSKEIITMLAKLSTNLNISPSYKGYVNEAKALSGKITELLANGATFSQAYKVHRILIHLLSFHIYGLNKPLYHYPIEVLGTPDEHPMIQLMYGTNSTLFKSYYYNKDNYLKTMKLMQESKVNVTEGFKYLSHTRNEMHSFYEKESSKIPQSLKAFLESDTLVMNKFPYNTISRLQIVAKMKDPSFAAALAGGHLMNGLSYLFKNNSKFCYSYKNDLMMPFYLREQLLADIEKMEPCEDNGVLENMMETFKIFETVSNKMELRNSQTLLKPCDLKMHNSSIRTLSNLNHRKLLCYINEPDFRNLLSFTNTEFKQIELFEEITKGYTVEEKRLLAENICQRSYRHFYFYSSMPTDKRVVTSNTDLLNLVCYNSFRGKYLKNLLGHKLPELISDHKNRVLIESIYVIRDMLNYIPDTLKGNFLTNFKVKFENEIIGLKTLRYKLSKFLSPYYSVMKYQLDFIMKDKNSDRTDQIPYNLPLIWYSKRQQGAGSTWFGEGSNSFMTRESLITITYNNSRVVKIHLNEDYEEDDLNYFISELSLTGVENPFHYKECTDPHSEKICIGFNDINDRIARKGLEKEFRFKYANCRFYETTHSYPSVTKVDIRKVKTRKNEIRYVRLAKDYTGLSLDSVLDCFENREWFKENMNVDVPWFYRRDIDYELTERPSIWNIERMEFDYAFAAPIENALVETKVLAERMYIPGLSPGILECIMYNRPTYLRTTEGNTMWQILSKQYPASFVTNVYQKWKKEKSNIMISYVRGLTKGDTKMVEGTRSYISSCMNLVLSKSKLPNKVNTFQFVKRVESSLYLEMLTSFIDMMKGINVKKYTKLEFDKFMWYLLFDRTNKKFRLMVYYEIAKLFENKFSDSSVYQEFQNNYGFPWCLVIKDKYHWMIIIHEFLVNFEKNWKEWLEETLKKYNVGGRNLAQDKYNKYVKSELNKVHEDLFDIYYSGKFGKPNVNRKFYDNADLGSLKVTKKYNYEHYNIGGDASNYNDKWYDNPDDLEEDEMDEGDEYGQERTDERILLLRDFNNPVKRGDVSSIVFGNPYQNFFIKADDVPAMHFLVKGQVCLNEKYCDIMINFNNNKQFKFRSSDGLKLTFEELREFDCAGMNVNAEGNIFRMGGLADSIKMDTSSLNMVKSLLEDETEIIKMETVGLNVSINKLLFNQEIAKTLASEKVVYSVYEPLGTFITDAGLESLMKQSFTHSYFDLLRGRICLTKNQVRDFTIKLKMNENCSQKEMKFLKTILSSVNVKQLREFNQEESNMNLIFCEELSEFLRFEEEEDSEEDLEQMFIDCDKNFTAKENLSTKDQNSFLKMIIRKQ